MTIRPRRLLLRTCAGTTAYIFYNFYCCSNKYLNGKAGAVAFIDRFYWAYMMVCRVEVNTLHTREKYIFCFITNICIELPESYLQFLGKARTLLTFQSIPKQQKRI